ncbi:MAG: hypothetical protein ABI920_11725 [Casimicrobiaceae bacterium]
MTFARTVVFVSLLVAALWPAPQSAAQSAGLYRCVGAGGTVIYATAECAGGDSRPMAVDRVTADDSSFPGARAGTPPGHRLTALERQRLVGLRQVSPMLPTEAGIAAELEIAAIREGADAALDRDEQALRDRLRALLASFDQGVRVQALADWRALYARHRPAPRPRIAIAAVPLDGKPGPGVSAGPAPPASAGARGPLVKTPEAAMAEPTRRAPAGVEAITGRVLAPAGEGLVDPLTGTRWLRTGAAYVDPLTGRMIPAP